VARPDGSIEIRPPIKIRLPRRVVAIPCRAIHLRKPEWRVLVDAIKAYVGSGPALTDEERRAVRVVPRLHEK